MALDTILHMSVCRDTHVHVHSLVIKGTVTSTLQVRTPCNEDTLITGEIWLSKKPVQKTLFVYITTPEIRTLY